MSHDYSENVRRAIAERAYFISEKQGFAPGHAEENWLTAKAEILADMLRQRSGTLTAPGAVAPGGAADVKKSTSRGQAKKQTLKHKNLN